MNVNKLNEEFPDLTASLINDVCHTHKEIQKVREVLSHMSLQDPEPAASLDRKLESLKDFLPLGRDVIIKILQENEYDVDRTLIKLVELESQKQPPANIKSLLNQLPDFKDLGEEFIIEILRKNNWDTEKAIIPLLEAKNELERKIQREMREKKNKEEQLRKIKEEQEKKLRDEEQLRRLREEEQLRKLRAEEQLRKLKEEEMKRLKEEEQLKRLKEEEILRKLKEEEEHLRKAREEEHLRKAREEDVLRKLREEEHLRKTREEEQLRKLREEEQIRKQKLKEAEEEQERRVKEEQIALRKAKEELMRKKEEEERKKRYELEQLERLNRFKDEEFIQKMQGELELKKLEEEKKKRIEMKLKEEERLKKEFELQLHQPQVKLVPLPLEDRPAFGLEASTTEFVHLDTNPKPNDISIKLTAKPDHIEAGETITIIWEHSGKPTSTDWIGLYSNNSSLDKEYLSYHWVNPETKTGSISIKTPTKPGAYVFKYFVNRTYVCWASSNVFRVGPVYRLTPTPVGTLEVSINVEQTFGAPSSSSWIGMYEPDKDNKSYHQYHYLSAKKDINFIAPKSGRWEFRVFPSKAYDYTDSISVDL